MKKERKREKGRKIFSFYHKLYFANVRLWLEILLVSECSLSASDSNAIFFHLI